MAKDKDYRNTEYCKALTDVPDNKQKLETEIQRAYPRTRIIYHKVRERGSGYNQRFAEIYNEKCAYCGISRDLLPVECFEVDHYINEASFRDMPNGRTNAGRMQNLVWSCISCNRGKRGITIHSAYRKLLNTDDGSIAKVFERDDNYYIQIRPEYHGDAFIKGFYDALHLGYQRRRLDYLLLQLKGKISVEKDIKKKTELESNLGKLIQKRNRTWR